jgi:four helix bundle protein
MRDPSKLTAFKLADELALATYRLTAKMPPVERFGLTMQMRKAAASVPSNIVEGCARHTEADYLRFLDIAYGSARELQYQISLAARLGLLDAPASDALAKMATETSKVINGLIRAIRRS